MGPEFENTEANRPAPEAPRAPAPAAVPAQPVPLPVAARPVSVSAGDADADQPLDRLTRSSADPAVDPSPPVRRLEVGHDADAAEVDADRIADAALRRIAGLGPAVRDPSPPGLDRLRRVAAPSVPGPPTANGQPPVGREGGVLDDGPSTQIESRLGQGRPLDPQVLTRMQAAFNADLSGVRIHADADAGRLNRTVGARAFTTGKDIFFGAGEYAPSTTTGQRVLAHELAHTIQSSAYPRHSQTPPTSGRVRGAGPQGEGGVVRRLIEASEKPRIQALSREAVIARMQNPLRGEEAGEIATLWLETNRNGTEKEKHREWVDLIRAAFPDDDAEDSSEYLLDDDDDDDLEGALDEDDFGDLSSGDDDEHFQRLLAGVGEEEQPRAPTLSGKKLWISEAQKLKKQDPTLAGISDAKIGLVLMVYRHGVFNPIGHGGNTRYIRSDDNAVIGLTVGNLPQAKNKAGEIPDTYKGITPREWRLIVDHLSKSKDANPVERKGTISDHIKEQRRVSAAVMECTKLPKPKKDETPLMTLIFDGNYAALNIHFPALVAYIKRNQEKKTKLDTVGAGQAKGMTKFLMGRLMYLCNKHIGREDLQLVEQSSFGFQRPTLGDLGINLSIRLSPGVSLDIVRPVAGGIERLHEELRLLMEDSTAHALGPMQPGSDMHHYWQGTRTPSPAVMLESFNKAKTRLDHLLFTQVENGPKGLTIVGRTFERNPDNILKLVMEDRSLIEWTDTLLMLHQPKKLAESLLRGALAAPQLLDDRQLETIAGRTAKDSVADQRLALFRAIAAALEDDSNQDEWAEEGSDSEFEDDGVSGGKAVVPSGMASLSQTLGNEVKTKSSQVGERMQPGLYFEDFDHAKKNFRVAGYTTADTVVVDLNPNLASTEDREKVGSGSLKDTLHLLEKSGVAVWMVDMTSSTQEDHHVLFNAWKANAKAELLITLVSGLKHQEGGLNTNPHGLTHWAYKGKDEDKIADLRDYFGEMRRKKVNERSKISNEMRRQHKKQGSHSWGRIGLKKEDAVK